MMDFNLFFLLLTAAFVGAAAGLVGSFMVLKRMSLVGDALSHVALPGMAIALSLNFNPVLGGFLTLFIAICGVWYLEKISKIYPEALVGIFFTASLAIGLLITPEPELLEALFGSIEKISLWESVLAIILSLFLIYISLSICYKILLSVISKDLAVVNGVKVEKINFVYLFLIAIIVALGVKFVGTLLMGALVIIPAVTAKNISSNLKGYFSLSLILGAISGFLGLYLSFLFHLPPGPIVVLTSIFFFLMSFFLKK